MGNHSLFEFGLVKSVLKALLGDFSVKVDRQAKLITIQAKGQEYKYTYDQLVDELEKLMQ